MLVAASRQPRSCAASASSAAASASSRAGTGGGGAPNAADHPLVEQHVAVGARVAAAADGPRPSAAEIEPTLARLTVASLNSCQPAAASAAADDVGDPSAAWSSSDGV